jgi:Leucine-rich repeat (LRR) protein
MVGFSMFSTSKTYTQNTYVPDDDFEQFLINNGYDSGPLDDSVPTENISGVTSLWVYGGNISDLTGIEDFISLTELTCSSLQLTDLDLSENTALTDLDCYGNQLTSLDLSANTALVKLRCGKNQLSSLVLPATVTLAYLNCYDNQLTSLDVSAYTNLTSLYFSNNQITSIDLSSNTVLTELNCSENQLTSIDLSENTALTELNCSENQLVSLILPSTSTLTYVSCTQNELTSLDLSENTGLIRLYCYMNELNSLILPATTTLTYVNGFDNNLTSLDISEVTSLTALNVNSNNLTSLDVSNNTKLEYLTCSSSDLTELDVSANTALKKINCKNNQLSSLDISANTALTNLRCNYNQLTSLDVRNGNNENFTNFEASDNINLTCIYVDDNTETYLSDWVKDETSTFVNDETECELLNNNAPSDITLSNNTIDEGVSPGTAVGILTATDEDTVDTHTFSLVTDDGTNDAGNSFFTIENDVLKSNEEFDYETQTEYNIYVKVEDAGELSFEKAFVISVNDVIETGINDIEKNKISTYPSPVKNMLTIQTARKNSYKVEIFDITGQLKVTKTFTSKKFNIDLSNIKAGLYIMSVSSGNEKVTQKILKQ